MSRRIEDFDEYCDPDNPRIIAYDDVVATATRINKHLLTTPIVPSKCQREFTMHLYYKLEFLHRSGSFKERGAFNALDLLPLDQKKLGVVVASLGNDSLGLCYYAKQMNIPVIVVMPLSVPISKLQQCHSLGAKVVAQGSNLMDSQKYARAIARDKGLTYINTRDHPHILEGYGTLGLEIMQQAPFADAIIVPVASGGLAAAVSTMVKRIKPTCLIYGVQPEVMPGFFKSLEMEEAVITPVQPTLAESMAVPNIGCNAFASAMPLTDRMVLVNEDWIARAMLHLMEKEHYVVEGAAACTLAAIIGNLVPELKLKNVVCILSGGNIDGVTLCRSLERGLSAEGRLVKFSVGIDNNPDAYPKLLKLVAEGGYNLINYYQDNAWVQDDTYKIQVKLVCEAKGLEHALELKRIIDRAYPCTAIFETEPFNDKRTCPCYVRKSMF